VLPSRASPRKNRYAHRLEGFDRAAEIVERHRLALFGEGGLEPVDILLHGIERGEQVLGRVGHLDAGLHRTLGLLGEISRPAVPKLGLVEDRVQNRRRGTAAGQRGAGDPQSGRLSTTLTRDGRFSLNDQGELVMASNGHRVLADNGQPIRVPPGAGEVRFDGLGQLTLNGEPIRVSTTSDLGNAVLATGFFPLESMIRRNLGHFSEFILRTRALRRLGSAALDLCWVAMGRFDGFWELGLNPWDATAGRLIVTEAGGRVTDYAGGEYGPRTDNLLCSNGLIHEQMMAVLDETGQV